MVSGSIQNRAAGLKLLSKHSKNTGFREMDQDHSLVKKLNISIDLVVYNTIIIDKIRVASSPLVKNFLVTEDRESNT